ncbi:MAG: GNAT family N-acetyltransferase [Bacteroidaceae bacterium]|nr:GNAT family N-acetyltransferase [Bacteroidaceae bacterium]MBQ5706359.1 GNAT family N-acetyltransferase [Bacteroidaceae bacterium]
MEYKIFEVTEAKEEYAVAIRNLLPQLSSSQHTFTLDTLQSLVANDCTKLFLLQTKESIVGMLTLCSALSPTGQKMWIEDVVIDASQRGRSLGRTLVEHAIEYVRTNHPEATLMLTSRPSRVAANALYRSAGFTPKETNVYSMKFDEQKK